MFLQLMISGIQNLNNLTHKEIVIHRTTKIKAIGTHSANAGIHARTIWQGQAAKMLQD